MSPAPLFLPARLGAIELKNRIVMAPMTRSRADAHGVPAPFAAKYYAQRAGAGLIITEATQVSFEGQGYSRTPGAHTEAQMAGWTQIVDEVHAADGRIVLQLFHAGRIASPLNRPVPAETVSASAIKAPGRIWTDRNGMVEHDEPRALASNEVARIAEDFAAAAVRAITAGFDGVEIHSANGYLPHQFLSTNVNRRTDRYGGSIENRLRMPLELVEAVTARIPSELVGVRISPGNTFNGIEEADLSDLYTRYIQALEGSRLAYLHVIRGSANDNPIRMARALFRGPVIANGGFDSASAAMAIEARGIDAVAFGQPFIANPDLPARLKNGATLTPPDPSTFYTPGEKGYTDYSALAA